LDRDPARTSLQRVLAKRDLCGASALDEAICTAARQAHSDRSSIAVNNVICCYDRYAYPVPGRAALLVDAANATVGSPIN